jgi:acetylornithine/succinyldiaminopimelate/putrescine aminotransferase
MAKGLAGGVPIGAMIATENAASAFEPGNHGTTFGGNPLATAAALAVLQEIDRRDLLKNASSTGAFITKKLEHAKKKCPQIADVRGRGLLIGIEFSEPVAVSVSRSFSKKGIWSVRSAIASSGSRRPYHLPTRRDVICIGSYRCFTKKNG